MFATSTWSMPCVPLLSSSKRLVTRWIWRLFAALLLKLPTQLLARGLPSEALEADLLLARGVHLEAAADPLLVSAVPLERAALPLRSEVPLARADLQLARGVHLERAALPLRSEVPLARVVLPPERAALLLKSAAPLERADLQLARVVLPLASAATHPERADLHARALLRE